MTKAFTMQKSAVAFPLRNLTLRWGDVAFRFRFACVVLSLAAITLLAVFSPRSPWRDFIDIAGPYLTGMILLTSLFVIPTFIAQRVAALRQGSQNTGKNWYRSYLRSPAVIDLLFSLASMSITVASFTVYKSLVIRAGGFHHDMAFAALDRFLFGGADAWRLTHALLPDPQMTAYIDYLYHPAFLPMIIGYAACAGLTPHKDVRYTYMIAYLASFLLIGMVAADLCNSAGPVFDGVLYGDGSTFGPLATLLHTQSETAGPFFALEAQDYLLTANREGIVKLGSGISAMPSMHVVLASLWALAAWRLNRWLGGVVSLYALFIWISSVHLGWHYASDGLAALAMLAVIWALAARLIGLITPPGAA